MSRLKLLLLVPVFALTLAGCGAGIPATTDGSAGSTTTDATPPTTPAALTASAVGSNGANLSWHPSMDNVAVTAYIIRRNGTQVGTSVATNYGDSGLLAGTTYNYSVAASDAAGNVSAPASASVTTATASGDTTPPSAPGNLVATAVGEGQIDLTWSASNDNVGVTGYRLERCAGTACTTNFAQISTPSALAYSDSSSLVASTTYGYRVRATDGAGNLSGFSSIAYATTQAATGATLPLGALAHDGPATPEQISLILPVTGSLPQTATATVRYKPTSSSTWITGHPLYRIRP
ncbi:MAG TPA: fibronectin type III domain-containing protein, partial [Burkholderiales bacterium]|nr:fibronectin type III domain-containing protein [Burkholderiales bacterium]